MLALCASCAWGTPSITQVSVRQQWPWSADIAVDFHLANDEGTPVDVSIVASNHNQSVNIPTRAVSGPRIGLTASGDYRLVIDPAKLGAGGATVLGDFSVTLSIAASRADRDFPLYRIYNLSKMTSTNVTVKALLSASLPNAYLALPFLPADLKHLMEEVLEKTRSAETLSRGGVSVDVAGFCFSGTLTRLTNGEIDLLKELDHPLRAAGKRTRVMIQALNEKLKAMGKPARIVYEMEKGYRLVNGYD